MKMAYVTWNKDSVADETIIKDLKILSNNELTFDENINLVKVEVNRPKPNAGRTNNHKNNHGKNNNNNNRNKKNSNGKQRY
jgi:hypothetical protein